MWYERQQMSIIQQPKYAATLCTHDLFQVMDGIKSLTSWSSSTASSIPATSLNLTPVEP